MSYDEFPPDAQPLPDEANAADRQETSAQDAPPAAPTRRRRARAAGTDAASETPTETSDTPARTRRRRTPVSAQDETPASIDADPAVIPPETEAAPEARPARRRRAMKAETAPELPADAPAAAESASPETEDAQPKTRRTRRSKAETATRGTHARRSGNRAYSRSRRRTDGARSQTGSSSPQRTQARCPRRHRAFGKPDRATREHNRNGFSGRGRGNPTETDAESSRGRRRQRGGRSRRGARETLETETASLPDVQSDETESLVASADAEAPVEGVADAPDTLERRRRNRRGGRNRRGDRLPTATGSVADAESDEIEALAAPVVEEIEAPVDLSVGAHLLVRHGLPRIHINGVAHPPLLFFGNMEGTKNRQRVLSEVRRAARAGVHLHSTLVELPCPLSEAEPCPR